MKHIFLIILFSLKLSLALQARDSLTVYYFLLDECRICQELAPELNAIYTEYHKDNVGFVGVFPNFSSKPKGIHAFKTKYKILFTTKTDYFKKLTHKFSASVLPEVIFYNESKSTILYRGQINDLLYAPSKRRHHVSHHYLRDAIDLVLRGRLPLITETQPIGWFINGSGKSKRPTLEQEQWN